MVVLLFKVRKSPSIEIEGDSEVRVHYIPVSDSLLSDVKAGRDKIWVEDNYNFMRWDRVVLYSESSSSPPSEGVRKKVFSIVESSILVPEGYVELELKEV